MQKDESGKKTESMRDDSLEKIKEMRQIMIAREKILETIFTWTYVLVEYISSGV